jgi:hypothetical protein
MYSIVLTVHSILRWFVVLAAVIAAARGILGWLNDSDWTERDNRLGLFFMIGMDVQVLIGLILYVFLSPVTAEAFADFGAAMASDNLRYFAVDHIFLMIVSLALVHAGRMLPKRTSETNQKHRLAALLFSMALVAILIAVPWNRPLLRWG